MLRTNDLVPADATERVNEVREIVQPALRPRCAVVDDVAYVSTQEIDRWRDHALKVGIEQKRLLLVLAQLRRGQHGPAMPGVFLTIICILVHANHSCCRSSGLAGSCVRSRVKNASKRVKKSSALSNVLYIASSASVVIVTVRERDTVTADLPTTRPSSTFLCDSDQACINLYSMRAARDCIIDTYDYYVDENDTTRSWPQ